MFQLSLAAHKTLVCAQNCIIDNFNCSNNTIRALYILESVPAILDHGEHGDVNVKYEV